MAVNADKPHLWKADIAASVDLYNTWFLRFAPPTYRAERLNATARVQAALLETADLATITPAVLMAHPEMVPVLRMTTAPPIARDRLIGLSGCDPRLVYSMEIDGRVPPRMGGLIAIAELQKVCDVVVRLLDTDIFPWLAAKAAPTPDERYRAATVVADRQCGAASDPIIRNAQERRQLALIKDWLIARGYTLIPPGTGVTRATMPPGTFTFRMNVPVQQIARNGAVRTVGMPIDAAIMPKGAASAMPLLVEAKSAGDFTNTNKRRKEEATKINQLHATYGTGIAFILFLCGYFGPDYLGYEAAEGIDWVWEHRIDDLAQFGV